jgi:hypothetical protein
MASQGLSENPDERQVIRLTWPNPWARRADEQPQGFNWTDPELTLIEQLGEREWILWATDEPHVEFLHVSEENMP